MESWPAQWQQALKEMDAPQATRARLTGINDGMLKLFESREDQDETLRTLNNGLLPSRSMELRQFQIAIQRYLRHTSGG